MAARAEREAQRGNADQANGVVQHDVCSLVYVRGKAAIATTAYV
jgi:hypothetical protein